MYIHMYIQKHDIHTYLNSSYIFATSTIFALSAHYNGCKVCRQHMTCCDYYLPLEALNRTFLQLLLCFFNSLAYAWTLNGCLFKCSRACAKCVGKKCLSPCSNFGFFFWIFIKSHRFICEVKRIFATLL